MKIAYTVDSYFFFRKSELKYTRNIWLRTRCVIQDWRLFWAWRTQTFLQMFHECTRGWRINHT